MKSLHALLTVLVQCFKAVARGLLTCLAVLHGKNFVHRDVRAENLVWVDDASWNRVVLIDLDAACQENISKPEGFTPQSWNDNMLNSHGCYDKMSDIYSAGKLLKSLAEKQQWSALATQFCDELIGKQLTASEALAREYLSR